MLNLIIGTFSGYCYVCPLWICQPDSPRDHDRSTHRHSTGPERRHSSSFLPRYDFWVFCLLHDCMHSRWVILCVFVKNFKTNLHFPLCKFKFSFFSFIAFRNTFCIEAWNPRRRHIYMYLFSTYLSVLKQYNPISTTISCICLPCSLNVLTLLHLLLLIIVYFLTVSKCSTQHIILNKSWVTLLSIWFLKILYGRTKRDHLICVTVLSPKMEQTREWMESYFSFTI